ncbi:antimicrobial peptide microplusin-like [Amblyomma americanum]
MKFLFACVLFGCSAVFASARQAAVCFASEDQIKEQAACVREQAGEFNARLDDAVTNLGCTDDLCAVQKLCSFLSTDQALRALFTRPEATLLRNLSLRCTAAAALVGTPGAGLPVASVGPAALAARPAFFRPRGFGARAFAARAFGVGAFRPAAFGPW